MFFSRLRRRAKWVFLLLAVVFALGFVGFGVGAQGNGIGDYIRDLVGLGSSSSTGTPSISDARKEVAKSPGSAKAHRDLANALQAAGQTRAAIAELESYTRAHPRDVSALQQLAALYGARANVQRNEIARIQAQSPGATFAQDLPSGPAASTFSGGPITELQQSQASSELNAAISATEATYAKQAAAYRKLTKVQPTEPSNFLQLGQAAYLSGDTPGAVAAWKRFLHLAPDDPNAPLIRRQLKQLQGATG